MSSGMRSVFFNSVTVLSAVAARLPVDRCGDLHGPHDVPLLHQVVVLDLLGQTKGESP